MEGGEKRRLGEKLGDGDFEVNLFGDLWRVFVGGMQYSYVYSIGA